MCNGMGGRMKKIILIITSLHCNMTFAFSNPPQLTVNNSSEQPNTQIIISNGGQGDINNNYVAFYANNSSALIGGYTDKDNDNGHCVTAFYEPGQPITIIVPEDLGKFGLVQVGCNYPNYSSKCPQCIGQDQSSGCQCSQCPTLCDGVVVQGAAESVTTSEGSNSTVSLSVSALCQQMAAYLIDNFSAQNTNFEIKEYANCDPSAISYCSVTFVPSDGFKLRINTNNLLFTNTELPGSCSVGSAQASSSEDTKQSQSQLVVTEPGMPQSTCKIEQNNSQNNVSYSLSIPTSSFSSFVSSSGSEIKNLNDWVNQNLSQITSGSGVTPPNGYFKCAANSSNAQACAAQQTALDKSIQDATNKEVSKLQEQFNVSLPRTINFLLYRLKRYPAYMPTLPSNPTATEKSEYDAYQKWLKSATTKEQQDYQDFYNKLKDRMQNALQKSISDILAKEKPEENEGIPCVGITSTDLNGDPVISYTCKTLGQTPDYTCNFIYTATKAGCALAAASQASTTGCTMQLSSAYCSFPPNLAMQSPQIDGTDFSCGFCGSAEINTVGSPVNDANTGIESGAMESTDSGGNKIVLYPYLTKNLVIPANCYLGHAQYYPGCTCPFGFSSYILPTNPGDLAYSLDNIMPYSSAEQMQQAASSGTGSNLLKLINYSNNPIKINYRNTQGNTSALETLGTYSETLNPSTQYFFNYNTGSSLDNYINGLVVGNSCQGSNPQINLDGSCVGVANNIVTDNGGTGIGYAGVSRSLTGKPLIFLGGENGDSTITNIRCTPNDPYCLLIDDNYNIKGSLLSQSSQGFRIFNASNKTIPANTILYNMTLYSLAGVSTGGTSSVKVNQGLNPFGTILPSLNWGGFHGAVTAAGYQSIYNSNLSQAVSGNGLTGISVSESLTGKPLMFIVQDGGQAYQYTPTHPNLVKLSGWLPQSSG